MSDENQILIPQSFIALFVSAGRLKANASQAVIASRYELCEDMAGMLVEHAQSMLLNTGAAEEVILQHCHQALTADASVFPENESAWIMHRLAELLAELTVNSDSFRQTY